MYLHIGGGNCVREDELVGIFDLDGQRTSAINASFLRTAQKNGRVEILRKEEIPRSFLVLSEGKGKKSRALNRTRVLISPISSSTLKIRFRDGIL